MARDNQKSRVYNAEDAALHTYGSEPGLRKLEDCQAYVDKVVGSRWWKQRFIPRSITVTAGYGRRKPGAVHGAIKLPIHGRNKPVILHELAHCANSYDAADHGPEFARIYLELVKRFMGHDAYQSLRGSYRKHRVRVGRNVVQKRPLPPKPEPRLVRSNTHLLAPIRKEVGSARRYLSYIERELAKGETCDLRKIEEWLGKMRTTYSRIAAKAGSR